MSSIVNSGADVAIVVPVNEAPSPITVIPAAFGCGQCGFDVRGQSIDGRCPECGHSLRDDLPSGAALTFYRLTPEVARRFVLRMVGRALVVIVAAELLASAGAWVWLGVHFVTVFPLVTGLLVSIATLVWAGRRDIRMYRDYVLVVGGDELVQRVPRHPTMRLRRNQVRGIQSWRDGTLVLCGPVRQFHVCVPAAMAGFPELRQYLMTWGPRLSSWARLRQVLPTVLALVAIVSGAYLQAWGEGLVAITAGTLVALGGAGAFAWQVYRNPSHTRRARWFLLGVMALAVIQIVMETLKRLS